MFYVGLRLEQWPISTSIWGGTRWQQCFLHTTKSLQYCTSVKWWQLDSLYQIALREFKSSNSNYTVFWCILKCSVWVPVGVLDCVGSKALSFECVQTVTRQSWVMIASSCSGIKPFLHIFHSSVYCAHTCAHKFYSTIFTNLQTILSERIWMGCFTARASKSHWKLSVWPQAQAFCGVQLRWRGVDKETRIRACSCKVILYNCTPFCMFSGDPFPQYRSNTP